MSSDGIPSIRIRVPCRSVRDSSCNAAVESRQATLQCELDEVHGAVEGQRATGKHPPEGQISEVLRFRIAVVASAPEVPAEANYGAYDENEPPDDAAPPLSASLNHFRPPLRSTVQSSFQPPQPTTRLSFHPVRRRPTHRGAGVVQGVKVERATVRTTWTPWAATARLCLGRRWSGWKLPAHATMCLRSAMAPPLPRCRPIPRRRRRLDRDVLHGDQPIARPIHAWARVGVGSAERAEGRSAGAARAGKRARRSGAQPDLKSFAQNGSSMPGRCANGRKRTGRIVQVMRVRAWVTETAQGCWRMSASRVLTRPSSSHLQASSDASASSAGEIVCRATATHLSACGAEYASKDPRSSGAVPAARSSVQHSHQ
ncbi:hypothetical protein QFZ75_003276 [Streptomyces sp. V3I8]|nr:hypothetical protein [Streptomyces sp. V3I8]